MLYFSRMQAAAVLLTVFVLCGFAVPSFVSEDTFRSWPAWAQRRLVLGPDVQGGTSILFEVDRNDVRSEVLESLRDEVRSVLRGAGINWANAPRVRANSVEVRFGEGDFQAGLSRLRKLWGPFNGVHDFDVVEAGGGLVRLTLAEAAVAERVHLAAHSATSIIERRINASGAVDATVQRQGSDRILVQVPRYGHLPMLEH
jgi:preprotein translocase subunit SecD